MDYQFPQPDYDARWKDLIKSLPRRFVKRFFPLLHDLIDWEKGVRFLDKELAKLLADFDKKGERRGDVLMEFHLKNGKIQLVLIHIETQHIFDITVPERMFITFYRLRDKYPGVPVAALALYTGSQVPAVFDCYKYEFHETKLTYNYPTFQVRNQKAEELLTSDDPIDLAILAGLCVLEMKGDVEKTFHFKRKLARLCFERGATKAEIATLLNFVSFLIALPEQEQAVYEHEIGHLLIETAMPKPLIEENPTLAKAYLHFLMGMSLEERDRERDREREQAFNRKSIIRLYQLGSTPEFIAKALNLEIAFVKTTIEEFKNSEQPS